MVRVAGSNNQSKVKYLVAIGIVFVFPVYSFWHYCRGGQFAEAAGHGDVAAVQSCLNWGMKPNTDTYKGAPAMDYAIARARKPYDKYIRVASILLDHGSDPNETLRCAVDSRKQEFAQLALARGADINKRFSSGDTPLSYAVCKNDLAMVKLLKRYGAHR